MNDESERPRNFIEVLSGDDSWEEYGLRIRWTEPIVPGELKVNTNQAIRLRVCVESKKELMVPPEELSVWCWTPIVTETNPRGKWKEIRLDYNPKCTQWDDHGISIYMFSTTINPLEYNTYRVTFNIKRGNVLIWNNKYQKDNILNVMEKNTAATQTTVYPSVHFTSNFCEGKEKPSQHKESAIGGEPRREEDLEMMVMM